MDTRSAAERSEIDRRIEELPSQIEHRSSIENRSRDALRVRVLQRMIPKSGHPKSGHRFSDKIMRNQKSVVRNSQTKAGMEPREAPGSCTAPRHAGECCHSLALRARRAPQNDPLARTACFGRAAPPGAPPKLSPLRAAVRTGPAMGNIGIVTEQETICQGKSDIYPRSGTRSTDPSRSRLVEARTAAARSALQPPWLALSRNFCSMSTRVSGSCAPPRM
jgi:hypothetical protein